MTTSNTYNPRDLESYVSDVEDPVQFSEAVMMSSYMNDPVEFQEIFFRVPSPHGMKPYKAYDYQKAISRDPADKVIINKTRQAGISICTILDMLHRGIFNPTYQCSFVSAKLESANSLIRKAKQMISSMEEEFQIPLKKNQESFFSLGNGYRGREGAIYHAYPSRQAATRGESADLVLDEFAHVPEDLAIMQGAMATTVRSGWRVRMLSTPYGMRGVFAGILVGTEKSKYNSHIHATKEQRQMAENWSLHEVHWSECPDLDYKRIRALCINEETFQQEYCCKIIDEATAMLPYELLMACTNSDMMQYSLNLPPATFQNRCYMGIDPASEVNETAIVISEFDKALNKWFVRHVYHKPMINSKIVDYVVPWFSACRPTKIFIDQNNIGRPLAADIAAKVGGMFVEPIATSDKSKEWLVYNLVGLFETHQIEIPHNDELTEQLHALEQTVSDMKKVKLFTGKVKADQDDLIWATALSVASNYLNPPPTAPRLMQPINTFRIKPAHYGHKKGRRYV